MATSIRTQKFRSRRTYLRALGNLVKSGITQDSSEFKALAVVGFKKRSKHQGKQAGAFGRVARKAHRDLYGAFQYKETA